MRPSIVAIALLASAVLATAQMGRSLDWPTYGGDPQRTGWEKSDAHFRKEDVAKAFALLWKVKPEGKRTLIAPVIVGNLIGYRGFKELAFIAGSDDSMYVMDADLNRMYWHTRFNTARKSGACSGELTAMPTLIPIGFRRPRPPAAGAAPRPPVANARPAPNPMFGPRSIFVLTSDGQLRRVNVANGQDAAPPVQVLPPSAKASTMNVNDNVLYTTTSAGCGALEAVWAIDLAAPDAQSAPKVASFTSKAGALRGLGGVVIGTDGTVYAQAAASLLALTPKDLQLTRQFEAPAAAVTPVLLAYKEHDVLVNVSQDGRLNLIDAASMAPLTRSDPVIARGGELWGGLSTWEDADGVRWILAAAWGPVAGGSPARGAIAAYKLTEREGKPALNLAWVSREMIRPGPPVIANGVVFALANGDARTPARLYALDGASGKEIWSTGDQVTAAGNLTGLTIANGRIYFATVDGTLWVFGMPLEW